jgi:hypothetical protein
VARLAARHPRARQGARQSARPLGGDRGRNEHRSGLAAPHPGARGAGQSSGRRRGAEARGVSRERRALRHDSCRRRMARGGSRPAAVRRARPLQEGRRGRDVEPSEESQHRVHGGRPLHHRLQGRGEARGPRSERSPHARRGRSVPLADRRRHLRRGGRAGVARRPGRQPGVAGVAFHADRRQRGDRAFHDRGRSRGNLA